MPEPAAPVPVFVPPFAQQLPTSRQQASIRQAVATIAATADLHPGITIVANLLTDTVEYMSERGLQLLQTSLPELQALGSGYHARFFNPTDAADYGPRVYALIQSDNPAATVSFFQQVRTTENPTYTWYFSTTRVLLRDEYGPDCPPLLLITTACPIDPLHHVTHKVSRLLEENNFLRRHAARFSQLTPREREVLRSLALGKSATEIAAALFLSAQTVETHRRNIRRKLAVQNSFQLAEYARAFDLI